MLEIVLATTNRDKIEEIGEISAGLPINWQAAPANFHPEENGQDFLENARIKAVAAAQMTQKLALADDSGLCVHSLNEAPGLYSARYERTPELRIAKLLDQLQGKTDRRATFHCAMALAAPDGAILVQNESTSNGQIAFSKQGPMHFGYDPVFIPDGYSATMAQLDTQLKNSFFYRGLAFRQIWCWIQLHFKEIK